MARGKGRKPKPPDPHRAERIRQARDKERRAREALDRTNALSRELGDRIYYDKICCDAQDRFQPLPGRLKDLWERRPDVLAACCLAQFEMQRDCDRLQSQVDQLDGKPPAPTLLEQMEPMLSQLPAKQANALRVVAALQAVSPEAAEETSVFRNASQWVVDCEEAIAAIERDSALVLEVAHERVKRGWADAATITPYETQMAPHFEALTKLKAELIKSRDYVTSTQTAHEDLRARRAEMRKRLGTS
ncbi:MAG: hypothetical protein ACREBE_29705 [bacterium]